jgi:hypothetical protein
MDRKRSFQPFRIIPRRTFKKMFDRFKVEYAQTDGFLQYFHLNKRTLENETPEQVGMEEEVHIECFNFLNFFLGEDLAEMDDCNISVNFALRTADPELLDVAVWVLRADNAIVKIVGDDNVRKVEEFPRSMVRPGMDGVFFQHEIFVSPSHVVSKDWMLIEIDTIQI